MLEPKCSFSPCVIIPSYNAGTLLLRTVESVRRHCLVVIVVIDGSTDRSGDSVLKLSKEIDGLYVLRLDSNQGKGAAVLVGLELAQRLGCSHAATIDSDGQHEVEDLATFFDVSSRFPEAMILGLPIFGTDAPWIRVMGRKVGNWWTNLETLWGGIGDSLFGFRIYPVDASIGILKAIPDARRFDFDTQLAVRLYWEGVPPVNLPTRVYYNTTGSGGISHFNYLRDNLLLTFVHARLVLKALLLVPRLLQLRRRPRVMLPASS